MTSCMTKLNRRPQALINPKLEKNLAAYIAAAGAAATAMFVAKPAQAKVVYTPANTVIQDSANIDLNHDGIADFSVGHFQGYYGTHTFDLDATPLVQGNAIRSIGGEAAAGFLGVPVGGGEKFGTTSYNGHGVLMAAFFQYSHSSFFGPFANVTNRYLGFKFLIDGQVHYGWARLTVTSYYGVTLTGYAYETIPNKTILEGHTSGPEVAGAFTPANLQAPGTLPATLGMLARGADGLSIWRRDEQSNI
jgi:hypothetical protein